jgi:ABC-type amino acid transport substrate-binding protein
MLWLPNSVQSWDAATLAVTYYHYPPKLLVRDGKLSGLYRDQMEDIARRAGYKVDWFKSGLDEEVVLLDAGRRAFCTTGRSYSKERAEKWRFLPYLFDMAEGDAVLVSQAKAEALKRYPSIAEVAQDSQFIGALLGKGVYGYGTSVEAALKRDRAWIDRTATTHGQLMNMVLAGRADWTIVSAPRWSEVQAQGSAASRLVEIPNFGAEPDYPIYIACSRALGDETFKALSHAMGEAGFEPVEF